jgi:hypothetical protein
MKRKLRVKNQLQFVENTERSNELFERLLRIADRIERERQDENSARAEKETRRSA